MVERRRYLVRLYGKSGQLVGIVEDVRTGAENPFRDARELVSLLRRAEAPTDQSLRDRRKSGIEKTRQRAPRVRRKKSKGLRS
jgi:hypothetical protein